MRNFFGSIGRLLLREVKLIIKDHSLLLTLLIAPLLYAFFYGSIYSYKVEEEVALAVVDADQSQLSRMFTEQLDNTQLVEVIAATNLQDAQEKMYRGECQGYLYIEKGMEANILAIQQSNVVLTVNAARFLPSSELVATVTQVSLTIGAGVRLKYNEMKGLNSTMALQETQPVSVDYRPLYNVRSSYGDFLLPGVLALILQQTLLLGLSGSVALDKQNRQIPALVQTGGGSLSATLWGKGLFYLLLFAAYATFFLLVNFNILELTFQGTAFNTGVTMLLFLLCLIPMGVWLGSLFPNQLLAAQLMAFSTYPFFLIAGYVWPYAALPVPVQWLSVLLPITPFLRMYQSVVQTGGTLQENTGPILHLLLLWVFYVLLALLGLRRVNRKQSQAAQG
ncbi:ABC transporter permease [Chitinophaga defluvii]|uniref:ABC transporter permease n=1 Tax=Chitinophaga defluvii TaxID=3163343 RepID=A0ABV2T295_9BACT